MCLRQDPSRQSLRTFGSNESVGSQGSKQNSVYSRYKLLMCDQIRRPKSVAASVIRKISELPDSPKDQKVKLKYFFEAEMMK